MNRPILTLFALMAHFASQVTASCSDLDTLTDTYWSHYADGSTDAYSLRFSASTIEVADSGGAVAATGAYSCLSSAGGGVCSFTEGSFSCVDALTIASSMYVLARQDGGTEVICLHFTMLDAALIYKLALSDDQARAAAGECRTQLDTDTAMGFVATFPSTYDVSTSSCPGEFSVGLWLAMYQSDAGWQCEEDSSVVTLSDTQVVLDTCFQQTPSYYLPYDATFTCIQQFSSTLVGGTSANGNVLILRADIGGTTRYFAARYNRAYSSPDEISLSLAAIDEDYCAIPATHTYSQYATLNAATGSGYKTIRFREIVQPTTTSEPAEEVTSAAMDENGAATSAPADGPTDPGSPMNPPEPDCPSEVVVDAMPNDLTSDTLLVLLISYDLPWHCNISTMVEDIKTPLLAKITEVVGDGYEVRLRYLRSGSTKAEVVLSSSSPLLPQVVSNVGIQLQAVAGTGALDFMLDGATVAAEGPLMYIYGEDHVTEIDDACFNYDARALCNDGTCVVAESTPGCACPDGITHQFCDSGNDDELILIIVLGVLSGVAVILLIFLGILIYRRKSRQSAASRVGTGIMRQRADHIPGPPKQPLPNPEDEDQEDPYTPAINSVAVHQPIHHANRGYNGPVQLSADQLKANGIGPVQQNRGEVYKITNTLNESYDWVKM